ELVDEGVLERHENGGAPSYTLTAAGRELAPIVRELGAWGQRWLPRTLPREELDFDALVWDVRRRVATDRLPTTPVVARIEGPDARGREAVRFLLLRRAEVSICAENPGFSDELTIRASLPTLTGWWRGDLSLADARSAGLTLVGKREWVRAFPTWFQLYV